MRRVLATALAWAMMAGAALAAGQTHLVVITGVPGDPEMAGQFHEYAVKLLDAAKAGALPPSNIIYLADNTAADPARIAARATRDTIAGTLRDLARRAGPDDEIVIVLIGHGTGEGSRFNVSGPDIGAADFAALLEGFRSQRVVFVNTASASGGYLQALSAPRRTIITATKTPGERNATRFPEFFAAAFGDPSADSDKDGRVSMLEAFAFARTKVEGAYKQAGLLLTEHAAVDDRADANRLFLAAAAAPSAAATTDPVLRAMYEEKRALEDGIEALRKRKDDMDPEQYQKELEKLATALALKTKEIREREKTVKD
jgi:hypothetical protein